MTYSDSIVYPEKSRIEWIDTVKGIGIILVVMGHTMFPLHLAIDMFHMPLFFFLSGLTFKECNFRLYCIKRTNSILIPFLLFSALSYVLSLIIPHTPPFNSPLWFLRVLFISLLIYCLLRNNISSKWINGVCLLLILFIYILNHTHYLSIFEFGNNEIQRIIFAVCFIHLGSQSARYINMLSLNRGGYDKKNIINKFAISALIFIIGLTVLIKLYGIKPVSYINCGIWRDSIIMFILVSCSGIAMTIFGGILISHLSILKIIGSNSLIIMCTHFPILQGLNVFVSSTVSNKILAALIIYFTITVCCCVFIIAFKHRYLKPFTGKCKFIRLAN